MPGRLAPKYFEPYKGLGSLGGNGPMGRWQRYHQGKLANIVFTQALHDRLQAARSRVRAVCCEPGIVISELFKTSAVHGAGASGVSFSLKVGASPEDGALP